LVDIKEVASNIYQLDDGVCSVAGLGAVYLLNEDLKALIDSGPTSSANNVLKGIKKVGLEAQEISYIIVTHIHLDHAGGAGALLKSMPRAKVVVHKRGARHLETLEKLVTSATTAQGSEVIRQYGEVTPLARERIQSVGDNDTIPLGDSQTLEIIDAPGHAPHEICIKESRNGGLFCGDALGVYLGGTGKRVLIQIHPPPSFDLATCLETVAKIKKTRPHKLYFAHFGLADEADDVLDRARDQLLAYVELAERAAADDNLAGLGAILRTQVLSEIETIRNNTQLYRFVRENLVASFVNGLLDYFQKKYDTNIAS